jgi:5-methylcytosine-specific restriction protein A
MPHRALQVCSTPICPTLVTRGACDECKRKRRRTQAQARRTHGDAAMLVYSTHTWRKGAPEYFERNPNCVDCGAPATQRDHVPPRRILVAAGIHNPDHPRWWSGRCDSCHSRATVLRDMPLLRRLDAGEDAAMLAEEAMQWSPRPPGAPGDP